MRTIIAVMLSWPPRAFARSTSCPAACAGGTRAGDVEDLAGVDEIAEPVGAEDEDVARDVRDRLGAELDLDLLRDAERAHDLVRVGMLRRVLGA